MSPNPLVLDIESFAEVMDPDRLITLEECIYGMIHKRDVEVKANQQQATKDWDGARVGKMFACTHVIDAQAFHDWAIREEGCWTDDQFVHEFARDVPDSKVKYAQKTHSIIVPAFKYSDVRTLAAA